MSTRLGGRREGDVSGFLDELMEILGGGRLCADETIILCLH